MNEPAATNNIFAEAFVLKKTSPSVLLVKQINLVGKVRGEPTEA
jgi:hypothetical protein